MANDRADRFDRADFVARPSKSVKDAPLPQTTERPLTAPPPLPPAEKAAQPLPVTAPPTPAQTVAPVVAPAWQRSELRPDDQIVSILETEPPRPPHVAPLTDDARTGFVLRDGNSNRVMLVDTGPAPTQRVAAGSAVSLVQGAPVALVQGTAVPMTAGQAVPLSQGTAVPAVKETSSPSPLSVIKQVLGNPALRTAAANALSAERSGDVGQQEQGETNFLGVALDSVLGEFSSS